MACSPARLEANRRNAALSTGPKTEEGKARSRANALKHGLTGEGVVLPDEDVAEVDRRFEEFEADLKPVGAPARFLARRAAMLSVRLERSARHESATIASKMRRAEADFERERLSEVDHAMSWIASEPATHARKLRSMPEGIDRLIDQLLAIRGELTSPVEPRWDWTYADRVSHLMGGRLHDVPVTRVRALSEAIGGNFAFLSAADGEGLDAAARRVWAADRMAERIAEEVASLRALREALDPSAIELDRAGASSRALFDPSKEATLARKYEAAAERALFRTLRAIREVAATPATEPGPPAPGGGGGEPIEGREGPASAPRLGSFLPEERAKHLRPGSPTIAGPRAPIDARARPDGR